MKLVKFFPPLLSLILLRESIAFSGERSFAYPSNVAKARLLQEVAKVMLPGLAPLPTEFNHFDFKCTEFSRSGPAVPEGYSFDAWVDVDNTYTCFAQIGVREDGMVVYFHPGKSLCGRIRNGSAR